MLYLEFALIKFESPHKMTEYERLEVYRKSFYEVVSEFVNKKCTDCVK